MAEAARGRTDDGPGAGRRSRLRRELLHALSEAALAEVEEHGAGDLSLRRVARRIGLSPAGLYRYVDSREDLLTRLIVEAYDDLADHLLAATGDVAGPGPGEGRRADHPLRAAPSPTLVVSRDADVAQRLWAVALAYRSWAVAHPREFALLFGEPVRGYAAPPGGVTVEAMGRVGAGLGRPLLDAWRAGRLRPLDVELEEAVRVGFAPLAEVVGAPVPAQVAATLLTAWGRLHGQVSLEVFGHHRWLFPDGCELLYRAEMERMLRDLGVTG